MTESEPTPTPSAVDEVLLAAPRGFCAGVEMAIKALAWMVRAFEPPVYCYPVSYTHLTLPTILRV